MIIKVYVPGSKSWKLYHTIQCLYLNAEVVYKRGVAGPENGTELNSNKQEESGKAFFGDYQPL